MFEEFDAILDAVAEENGMDYMEVFDGDLIAEVERRIMALIGLSTKEELEDDPQYYVWYHRVDADDELIDD